ncbi:MAG: proton-conducting transporter membrane subunit, partial [Microbacteriaceae bacterium]
RMDEIPIEVQTVLHVMLLVAFGIKAAVFPLSFWLPDSYPTAPAPVTAVFAGLLTKVGVYAILRTETLLFPGSELNAVLLVIALLTMVIGVLGAVAQTDIKRLLSFTLVSHIGYMILGVGLGTIEGTTAAIYYVVHHIVVQTTLFLATGLIERVGGTTSITRLGGLLAASPLLAILFFVPALNLGGIPPFSGFIGKLALFQASAEQNTFLSWTLVGAGALVSLLTLYALIRVWSLAFWRSTSEVADEVKDAAATRAATPEAAGIALSGARPVTATIQVREARSTPKLMIGATAGMVVVSVLLTVFAGPLYALSARAGESLESISYIDSVFPDGGAP